MAGTERLGWGIVGAAWIADIAVAPAIAESRNGRLVALASRSPERAEELAVRHGIARVHQSYQEVVDDPQVDCVYIPLINSRHREWAVRALRAGKHVLCEKPLAMNADEAVEMARVAAESGRLLMEAFMYRFHPRTRQFVEGIEESVGGVRHVHACFGFPLSRSENYRWQPALGGGALLDVGCYVVNVSRWILGEPTSIAATAHAEEVDLSVSISLGFRDAQASLWASFESAEHQELVVVGERGVARLEKPFTSHRDPHDPYRLMVEAFADAVAQGGHAPIPLGDSIANLRLLDSLRVAARLG
ncbi:MAG TPA: Gfo/Idh/MocA family oxidoreductase [Candidatus Sulfotelmatobacter sp.]|nr:Gfo/Idh/MocA family oxidoreductase [Candidatus Sulfotelmatobacter sp.]